MARELTMLAMLLDCIGGIYVSRPSPGNALLSLIEGYRVGFGACNSVVACIVFSTWYVPR